MKLSAVRVRIQIKKNYWSGSKKSDVHARLGERRVRGKIPARDFGSRRLDGRQEMLGLEFRYVGQDRLPYRLSEFDGECHCALTDSDVAAINERFRRDRRASAAIRLVFLRASGHTLDHVGTLPRQLLRYVGERRPS
ncbi:hypothetical protein PQQ51_34015 [Paraburkholderia xenovorans]|uniref:hypothetical protein n=1 Tax=Paraburkholderia xenovorans TaxID=36873 RepID=UPI0038BD06E7